MAKKRRGKAKKLTVTQQYQRKYEYISYFAEKSSTIDKLLKDTGLGERKRASNKLLKEINKLYTKTRKQLRDTGYEDLPNINQFTKWREAQQQPPQELPEYDDYDYEDYNDEYIPYIPVGKDFCDNFIEHIHQTYEDSLEYARETRGDEAAGWWDSQARHAYEEALSLYKQILNAANHNYEVVAQAIKDQPDYDVYMSTDYIEPSDLEGYFERCTDFFVSVMKDVSETLML